MQVELAVITAFLADDTRRRKKWSEATQRAYSTDLALFVTWLAAQGEPRTPCVEREEFEALRRSSNRADTRQKFRDSLTVHVLDLDEEGMKAYFDSMESRSLATKWRKLLVLRGFYRWCVAQGLCARNPAEAVQLPRRGSKEPRITHRSDVEMLLTTIRQSGFANHRDRVILLLLLDRPFRASELVGLQVTQVEERRNEVVLHLEGEDVTLSEELATEMLLYLHERNQRFPADQTGALLLSRKGRKLSTRVLRRFITIRTERAVKRGVLPRGALINPRSIRAGKLREPAAA